MNVGIVGAGAWGMALAILSARGGHTVTVWSYGGKHHNFIGIKIPKNVTITKNMADLSNCDAWLIATPAEFFGTTMRLCRKFYNKSPIIICAKGIDIKNHNPLSVILRNEIPECNDIGVLSGPQFADEVAKGIITGSTLAGTKNILTAGKKILSDMYIQETDDIIGTEYCGIGKNAVALISGFASVEADGQNDRALLFTRAWDEVVKIGIANGAKTETFLGLCGIGDLFLSATSTTSRNYSAGVAIAKKQKVSGTVEGISALIGLIHQAKKKHIDATILIKIKTIMGL